MATVTPGKTFTSNEIVTPANLNLLGTPTVALENGEVTTAKIATDAVTTAKIADANVTTAKIAANAVTAAKLGTTEQRQICKAWVNFNGVLPGVNSATGVTYARSGTAVTVTSPNHGLPTGYGVILSNATDSGLNIAGGGVTITNTGTNTFTFQTSSTGATTGTLNWQINVSIRSSYNVSSITKNGAGDYTVNFTTPMADANYSSAITRDIAPGANFIVGMFGSPSAYTLRILCLGNGVAQDSSFLNVQVFGN